MRKIKYFDNEMSVDEFIKIQIVKNAGVHSFVLKKDLIEACTSRKIKFEKKSGKEQLLELLINNGVTYKELAEKYKIGISSKGYQETFGITHKQVKNLEKQKIINVVGSYEFRAYGKYLDAPLYDVYQLASISEEVIKNI